MAKIISPLDLNQGIEVIIDKVAKTIELVKTGNLSNDGVTLRALYSFLMNEWINDDDLISFLFPMNAISDDQYEFVNGWYPLDFTTRKLIRDSGWSEFTEAGVLKCACIGLLTLGDLNPTTQPYYQQEVDGSITNTIFLGKINEPIQIYGDIDNGNFDYRSYFKVFARDQGETYADADLEEIEVTELESKSYAFPISHDNDLDINESDIDIENNLPFTGITITYYNTPVLRDIDGVDYEFNKIIEGNGATLQQIYNKIQYLLRQNSDIDSGAGTVIGSTADLLLEFIGSELHGYGGVFIDNFQTAESKNLNVYDVNGTLRPFPIVSVLTVTGLVTGSYVGIYDNEIEDNGNNNTLLDFINSSGTSFSYTHDGTDNDVVISVIKDGYEELRVDQHIGVDNASVNVIQKIDNND